MPTYRIGRKKLDSKNQEVVIPDNAVNPHVIRVSENDYRLLWLEPVVPKAAEIQTQAIKRCREIKEKYGDSK